MVSVRIATTLIFLSLALNAQTPAPSTPLNAEQRGDILMARKMYREAIDVYREGPQDSAVIWNKIGIAYHQMMQVDEAKRNYEKAIKLNPKYSEAINNLGTVYYSKKSYRRAISQYRKALKWMLRLTRLVDAQVNDPDFPAGRQFAPEVKGRLIQLQYSWDALDNPMGPEEADSLIAQYFPDEPGLVDKAELTN